MVAAFETALLDNTPHDLAVQKGDYVRSLEMQTAIDLFKTAIWHIELTRRAVLGDMGKEYQGSLWS